MITLPISFEPRWNNLSGATWDEVAHFYPSGDPIRQIERASIRAFVEKHRQYLRGRVLDFGAGTQPYSNLIVEGEYVPHEKGGFIPYAPFDVVMINQVMQYVKSPSSCLDELACRSLRRGGHLVMTYASNWAEVEADDYWRFTKAGMERLLTQIGFTIITHELRAEVAIGSFTFPLGYGVVAQR